MIATGERYAIVGHASDRTSCRINVSCGAQRNAAFARGGSVSSTKALTRRRVRHLFILMFVSAIMLIVICERSVASMATGDSGLVGDVFFLDHFAQRQWDDPNYQGPKFTHDKADFVARIHEHHSKGAPLVDGYAPFCKHVFVPNFTDAQVGCVKITPENKKLIETAYQSRRPEELAVLGRWFAKGTVEAPVAKMLDIILYSREQIIAEYEAMPSKGQPSQVPNAPWGIISIKAQDEDYETPMQPITIMRNALGRDEGGSGVPIDKAKYDASVNYWQDRAPVI